MSQAMVMPPDASVSSGDDNGVQDVNLCAVCRHACDASETTSTTPCGHVFHFGCLAQSLTYNRSCPLCRQTVPADDTVVLTSSTVGNTPEHSELGSVDIDISGPGAIGSGSFRDLFGRFLELPDGHLDLYVSNHAPLPTPPSPPSVPSPTPENVIRSLKLGNASEVENMLSHDSRLISTIDADGDTLLHLAVLTQHVYMVEYLRTTADIPANSTNKARLTPLHYAVIRPSARIVCLLVDLGSCVDAADACGRTPLMHATMNRSKQLVDLLLQRGANVNATDLAGDTALHYASKCGYFAGVKALVACGQARVNAVNCVGETPLHVACLGGSAACIRFLVISGANPANKTKSGRVPDDYLVPA